MNQANQPFRLLAQIPGSDQEGLVELGLFCEVEGLEREGSLDFENDLVTFRKGRLSIDFVDDQDFYSDGLDIEVLDGNMNVLCRLSGGGCTVSINRSKGEVACFGMCLPFLVPGSTTLLMKRRLGEPQYSDTWVGMTEIQLKAWLRVAFLCSKRKDDIISPEIVLCGQKIHSKLTFLAAMGEAVNGPGGYFGQCLDGLDDCLIGVIRVRTPIKKGCPGFLGSLTASSL